MKKKIGWSGDFFSDLLPPLVKTVISELNKIPVHSVGSDIDLGAILHVIEDDGSTMLLCEYWKDNDGHFSANLSTTSSDSHNLSSIAEGVEKSKLNENDAYDVILFNKLGHAFDLVVEKVIIVKSARLEPRS
jgi:hypothetical protein